MSFKFSNTFWLFLAVIAVGALSGIIGFIIIGAGDFKIPFVGKIDYGSGSLDSNIVIQQPRSVVIEQDTQIQQIENKVLSAIINLYYTKKSTDPLVAAYNDRDVLGRGLILTADGWLISSARVLDNPKGSYTAVGYQNKKYALSNIISDEATGLAFARINASNLPVVKIGKSSDLHLGQMVVVVGARNELLLTSISKIGYTVNQNKDLILNSDNLNKRINVTDTLTENFEGGALVNFKGEVVGIISGGSIISADYFSNIINNVLEKQKVIRASLGVDYIDLAQVDGLINLGDKGAYVVYEPLKETAAYGLIKKGDIIKKINDLELSAFIGLAEAINKYQMGDRIDILLSRNGKDLSSAVVLK